MFNALVKKIQEGITRVSYIDLLLPIMFGVVPMIRGYKGIQ
jgi:hypothetical protein